MVQAGGTHNRDYRSEFEWIVKRIKNDPQFAGAFFFGSAPEARLNILCLRLIIIIRIRKEYGVEVSSDDLSTILYEHLWDDGTWRVLDTYNYKCSFFNWLSIVALRCMVSHLEANGYVNVTRQRTPANTRLVLKSKDPEYCKEVIDAMVTSKPLNDFLTAMYVSRLTPAEIQKRLGLDGQSYKRTQREAETALKAAILDLEQIEYWDVLSDKSKRKNKLSLDEMESLKLMNEEDGNENPLACLIKGEPGTAQFDSEVIAYLYDFSDRLFDNCEDRYIWQERFIREQSPVELAQQLGRSRSWLDTRYSRLNAKFRLALREEWEKQNKKSIWK